MIEQLIDFHGRMFAVTEQVEPYLRGEAADPLQVGAARLRQARLITAHQLFVHREVFEPIIACGSLAQVGHAKALKVECIALAESFRLYARRWALEDVEAHWSEYQPTALSFIDRIRGQITNITALAAPLVDVDAEYRLARDPSARRAA
ncbi:MAG: hypothetical protein JOY99_14685 [Sphingomonadaceae bacterium]|nr:hypothetical protein [Sphingomonadaceae bacterium]